jgi:cytidylate kinase
MIITIDGPAGSGKSTAARQLALALGIAHLDTGATYRAVTLAALRAGINLADEAELLKVARAVDIRLAGEAVLLGGLDVSAEIRRPDVTENSRYAAASPAVRAVLVDLQRSIGLQLGSFVTEGRDQGSVVFPDAQFKFYLDASAEVRASRRQAELQAAGLDANYEQVLEAIVVRDGRDKSRAVAPLIKPADAIVIDTSDTTIQQVTDAMLDYVRPRK